MCAIAAGVMRTTARPNHGIGRWMWLALLGGAALLTGGCPWLPAPDTADREDAAKVAYAALQRDGNDLFTDATEQDVLTSELALVLARIRDADPVMRSIRAMDVFAPGEVIVILEADLYDSAATAIADKSCPFALVTGGAAFDDLNAQVGVHCAETLSGINALVLELSQLVNIRVAIDEYSGVAGVRQAEANGVAFGGTFSYIGAKQSGGTWHVVLSKSSEAECPECGQYFFKGTGLKMDAIPLDEALGDPLFVELRFPYAP